MKATIIFATALLAFQISSAQSKLILWKGMNRLVLEEGRCIGFTTKSDHQFPGNLFSYNDGVPGHDIWKVTKVDSNGLELTCQEGEMGSFREISISKDVWRKRKLELQAKGCEAIAVDGPNVVIRRNTRDRKVFVPYDSIFSFRDAEEMHNEPNWLVRGALSCIVGTLGMVGAIALVAEDDSNGEAEIIFPIAALVFVRGVRFIKKAIGIEYILKKVHLKSAFKIT